MADFRVSTNQEGQPRWWIAGEEIPATHQSVRVATVPEAVLMRRIMAHDAARRMPPAALGQQLGALLRAGSAA